MKDSSMQLASRFSLAPNSLGYCGKKSATAEFENCISDDKCDGVKEELKNFIVLFPYLKTLSKILKQSFHSYSVIESYWLGSAKLKKAKQKDYFLLLDNFAKQGVPGFFIEELKVKKPKQFIPNHLFHVLFIGVGKASKVVPFNLDSINNCMIRWGKVEKIEDGEKATVLLNSLKKKTRSTYLLAKIKVKIPFKPWLTKGLMVGDTVAVHWGFVIKILTKKEEDNLKYWTKEVLKLNF